MNKFPVWISELSEQTYLEMLMRGVPDLDFWTTEEALGARRSVGYIHVSLLSFYVKPENCFTIDGERYQRIALGFSGEYFCYGRDASRKKGIQTDSIVINATTVERLIAFEKGELSKEGSKTNV